MPALGGTTWISQHQISYGQTGYQFGVTQLVSISAEEHLRN
jgi:hypothetical protein